MSGNTLKTAVLAFLMVTGAFVTSANAQLIQIYGDPYAREVDQQIGEWIDRVWNQGFRRMIINDHGVLYPDGGPALFRLRLQSGVEYRFAARCDSDCYDLDLVLENSAGQEVMADRDRDDTPGFRYLAPRSGEYTIKLELANGSGARTQVGAAVVTR